MANSLRKLVPGGKYKWKIKINGGGCLRYIGITTTKKYVLASSKYGFEVLSGQCAYWYCFLNFT